MGGRIHARHVPAACGLVDVRADIDVSMRGVSQPLCNVGGLLDVPSDVVALCGEGEVVGWSIRLAMAMGKICGGSHRTLDAGSLYTEMLGMHALVSSVVCWILVCVSFPVLFVLGLLENTCLYMIISASSMYMIICSPKSDACKKVSQSNAQYKMMLEV